MTEVLFRAPGWLLLRLVLLLAYLASLLVLITTAVVFLNKLWPLVVLALIAVALQKRPWRGGGWAHGTARWASLVDLDDADMLAGQGLLLGEESPHRPTLSEGLVGLFRLPLSQSRQACRLFLAALSGKPCAGELIRLARYQNILVTAPTGAGKGVSLVIPWLLEYRGSCVVLDLKGELFQRTARCRRALGQKVVRLDPFGVCGEGGDSFNPLDLIPDDPEVVDAARALAAALVVRTGMEQDEHWQDQAENLLTALTAFVLTRFQQSERTLGTVREVLTDPALFAKAIEMMAQAGGVMRRLAGLLAALEGKELSGVKSTANRHSVFLDSPAIEATVGPSTFDARTLLQKGTTVYLILPPDQMEAQSRWLRLVISSFIRLIGREGTGKEILFLLDEAGQLGYLPALEQGLTLLRARGLKLALFYQSAEQVKVAFRTKESLLFDNCDCRIFFGVNSQNTAQLVSDMIGEATIAVESYSENESRNWQEGGHATAQAGVQVSRGRNHSYQEQGRRLLKPEEVLALDGRIALAFVKGVPPICCRRILYHAHPRYVRAARRAAPPRKGGFDWLWVILALLALACLWTLARRGG